MVEAATNCTRRIKRIIMAIILRNCHKTKLIDLPLKPLIDIEHLRVGRFLMVIQVKNGETWVFLFFLRFHPQATSGGRSPPSKSFSLRHHRHRLYRL